MKLKKIASLMLAGIMAVSMLAGCKDGASSSEPTEPVTPVTSNVADAANGERSDYIKNGMKVSYIENADVTNALSAAVASEFKTADIKATLSDTKYDIATYQSTGAGQKVATKVFEGLTGTSANNVGFNGLQTLAAVGTKKSVVIYAVGGSYDADDAGALVSRELNKQFTSTATPISQGAYKADYTVELSAVKATSAEDSNVNVWIVAVVVTQTVSNI